MHRLSQNVQSAYSPCSLVSGQDSTVCVGLTAGTQVGICELPSLLTGTAVTLSGAEAVQERPLLSRESKIWLSNCGVVHEVGTGRWWLRPTSRILSTDYWCQLVPRGFLDDRRSCGGLEISWCSGQISWALAFATSLSVAAFLRRAGGLMLARTGSHGSRVGRRVPDMRCIMEFNCTSTSPVWAERHHTEAQYSPAE